MTTEWRITQKPDFFKALLALSPKETHQVLEKINLLAQDPTPDAKVKKQLKHIDPRLHRIRCGDYRIFYTFEHPYISLLALRRRKESTYDEDLEVEFLGGYDAQIAEDEQGEEVVMGATEVEHAAAATKATDLLPEPITLELLSNL